MKRDLMYYFDKNTNQRYELGEIQTSFNMSFVIDGTKDSCKVVLKGGVDEEITPFTLLWHEATNTWWVVSHDKVERYMSEEDYYYVHSLQLLGAIEMLNARDLTDCGFNENTYTIESFIRRLFTLSTFDKTLTLNISATEQTIDLSQQVDFIKTFENYTLLSAIKEFCDAYNIEPKLEFTTNASNVLVSATLVLLPKTGIGLTTPLSMSHFKDVRQTRTMNKNSYGTSIVSNAENVISTMSKTYPLVGGVRLKSNTNFTISNSNAKILLPSPVYKVNWVKMYYDSLMQIVANGNYYEFNFTGYSRAANEQRWQQLEDFLMSQYNNYQPLKDKLDEIKETIIDIGARAGTSTFYNGAEYNIATGQYEYSGDNEDFYFVGIFVNKDTYPFPYFDDRCVLQTEEDGRSAASTRKSFWWKRGSNEITHFDFMVDNLVPVLSSMSHIKNFESTDLGAIGNDYSSEDGIMTLHFDNADGSGYTYIDILFQLGVYETYNASNHFSPSPNLTPKNTHFAVNYIPMSDMKVKLDNKPNSRDIHLYNQNGKLTDSNALSKLLLSQTKKIESTTLTKYSYYYSFDSVPKIGQVVLDGGDLYVINNISLDIVPNESKTPTTKVGYYISGEFTMSKYYATKSLMVNPNTNIRDYGIPQNYNVKRKQLYRDFYELYHYQDFEDNDYYLRINKVMNVGNEPMELSNHVAVMKLTFDSAYGSEDNESNVWYYQLDTTQYVLKKSYIEMVDLQDNNIIGYDSQNAYSGFDISRLFTGMLDTISTPISYVDPNGQVKDFEVAFVNATQLNEIYEDFRKSTQYESSTKMISNFSVFIDSMIYEGGTYYSNPAFHWYGAKDKHDFLIEDIDYRKDAIEVPVFEYMCQIDNSDDVIIGYNVLNNKDTDYLYLYSIHLVPKGIVNEDNWLSFMSENPVRQIIIDSTPYAKINMATTMSFSNTGKTFHVRVYLDVIYDMYNKQTYSASDTFWERYGSFIANYDIMVVRHNIYSYINDQGQRMFQVKQATEIYGENDTQTYNYYVNTPELMLVIRNTENIVGGSNITLSPKHIQVKD